MTRVDWGDDRGQVGGIEALPFGLLIFVIGALLVVNAWGVVDAKFATDAAAREAARTYVEGDAETAEERAIGAGKDAIAAHGRDPRRAIVRLAQAPASGFQRCQRITFEAVYEVPAIAIPIIGGYGDGFRVRSAHSELIDPLRSGLEGEADGCAAR
jgi:hypothetical protein